MCPSIRNERGQFIRQLKPWSLDNFDEGFVSKRRKGNRFMVYLPNHPRANKMGHIHRHITVYEAVHRIEVKPPYVVHHMDGNTLNDNPENLLLMTISEHRKEHLRRKGRELKLVIRTCEYCRKEFNLKKHRLKDKDSNRGRFCSQECYHAMKRSDSHKNNISEGLKRAYREGRR